MSDSSEWVSVTEAAQAARVSERTVWRWIHQGDVESRSEKRGQRETRLVNRVSLPASGPSEERSPATPVSGSQYPPSQPAAALSTDAVSQRPAPADDSSEGQGLTGAQARVECECCKVRGEQVSDLRAQLERRTEEAAHQAVAEEQLRVLLMQMERTNAELAGVLVQKALPPALSEAVPETPSRVRWWWPWRGRGRES